MNARLRELAEREGLPLKVAQDTLSRLVREALAEQERRENEKAAEAPKVEPEIPPAGADVVQIDEQRRKRGRRHRRTCESCRVRFTASRRHARFCSVACRMRAYRKRQAA